VLQRKTSTNEKHCNR